MNGNHTKLNLRQQAQTESVQEKTTEQETAKDFNTVDEMLRFDSSQNPVPGKVAERLQQSVEREKITPPQPWWKRLFGK